MLIYLSVIEDEDDQCKFIQIYEKYKYFMWFIANETLHDKYLAEDAVQDAFFSLTRHLDKVDEIECNKTKKFLATIVKSKSIDIIRKKKGIDLEEFSEELLNEHQQDILEEYIEKEKQENIVNAIKKLDDIYKVVFEYKYLHDLSDREIAQILGVTAKVVNVRIYRARKKLQEILLLQKGE